MSVRQLPSTPCTCVSRVGALNPDTGVPVIIQAKPLLDSNAWATCLASHPDKEFTDNIIKYTNEGVNDYISPEDSRVSYVSFDDITRKVYDHGRGSLLAKLDLADAYKHVLVHPDDWDLLGCTWNVTHHMASPARNTSWILHFRLDLDRQRSSSVTLHML